MKYIESSIIGIAGKPWIDFTQYTNDGWDWERIDDEICLCMAKHDTSQVPNVFGKMPRQLIHDFNIEILEDEFLKTHPEYSLPNLDTNTRRRYLYFKNKVLYPWSFVFVLKPNSFKNINNDSNPWFDFVDIEMPYTKKMISSLPFNQIGRVVIYGSNPNNAVPCHRDAIPILSTVQSDRHLMHHINMNPGGYRPVYLYDSKNNKKVYVDPESRLYAYNVRDFHGVDAVNRFSYTVRIDGEYSKDVCERIGLPDKS
jgi:hypothetical protein